MAYSFVYVFDKILHNTMFYVTSNEVVTIQDLVQNNISTPTLGTILLTFWYRIIRYDTIRYDIYFRTV